MQPDAVRRRLDSLPDLAAAGKPVNGLFRLLASPVIWEMAYADIASNTGAATTGSNGQSLDGFSQERVASIIARLMDGTYRFTAARRVKIPKPSGGTRRCRSLRGTTSWCNRPCGLSWSASTSRCSPPTRTGFGPGGRVTPRSMRSAAPGRACNGWWTLTSSAASTPSTTGCCWSCWPPGAGQEVPALGALDARSRIPRGVELPPHLVRHPTGRRRLTAAGQRLPARARRVHAGATVLRLSSLPTSAVFPRHVV